MTETIVTIENVRGIHLCVRGARTWAKKHGLNYAEFLRNGFPASVLLATGDAFAIAAVEHAERQRAAGGQQWQR